MRYNTCYIVGCGGIGCWLALCLAKSFPPDHIHLIDGDIVEERNLDRQLFSDSDIGSNKAKVLAGIINANFVSDYIDASFSPDSGSLVFGCVDNHPARREILAASDRRGCDVIIAANEIIEAEAYFYMPNWSGTGVDPRIYYPAINTDRAGDPRMPCTGQGQVAHPQLAAANMAAASYAMILCHYHCRDEIPDMRYWPYHFLSTGSTSECRWVEDKNKPVT